MSIPHLTDWLELCSRPGGGAIVADARGRSIRVRRAAVRVSAGGNGHSTGMIAAWRALSLAGSGQRRRPTRLRRPHQPEERPMIRSMTAFARESGTSEVGQLTWELRSVNHRFLEPHVRLPEELRGLESAVRERLALRLGRGKIDCTLRFAPERGSAGTLTVNRRLMEQVLGAAEEVATRLGEPATPHVIDLLRWPGLLQEPEQDPDAVAGAALAVLERALDALVGVREREGARLRELILERCDKLGAQVDIVRARMPEVLASVRKRIRDRLARCSASSIPAPGAGDGAAGAAAGRGRGNGPLAVPRRRGAQSPGHRQGPSAGGWIF
jgi:hypothetical protein